VLVILVNQVVIIPDIPVVIPDSIPVVNHPILLSYQNENQHLNRELHTHLRPNHQPEIILCLMGIHHNHHRLHRLL